MLVVRLQRTGRRNLPTYRMVVADKAAPIKGKIVEIVGHYLPARNPTVLEVNQERISYWTSKGAIPSDTVARLLKKQGMGDMDKFIKRYAKRRSRNAPEEEPVPAAAPAAAAPAPEVSAETPAEPETAPVEAVPEAPAAEEKKETPAEEPKEEPVAEPVPTEAEEVPAAEASATEEEGDKAA